VEGKLMIEEGDVNVPGSWKSVLVKDDSPSVSVACWVGDVVSMVKSIELVSAGDSISLVVVSLVVVPGGKLVLEDVE